MRKLSLILWSVAAYSATTTVSQTIIGPDGQPASGTVAINISAACQSGADLAVPKTVLRTFAAGQFSVNLVPNDTCAPAGTTYTVGWTFSDGRKLAQTWSVPTSASPVTVDDVTVPAASAVLQTYAARAHASTHASAGSDPVTPAAIGAATSGHDHAGAYEPVDARIVRRDDAGNVSMTGTLSAGGYGFAPRADQNFVFEGDSMMTGYLLSAGKDWPTLAMALPWFANRGTKYNVAIAGTTLVQMAARYTANVHPLRPTGAITTAYLFLLGGTNDIGGGAGAATVYANLTSYLAAAKADGFTVVAGTIPSRKDFFGTTKETNRLLLNQMIRESVGTWDYLIDFDAVCSDPYDTTCYLSSGGTLIDGIHPGEAGTAMWAALANAVMSTGIAKTPVRVPSGRPPQLIANAQETGLTGSLSAVNLCGLLPGAVCPVGTYQVNPYYYTTVAGAAGSISSCLIIFHNGAQATYFATPAVTLTTLNGHSGQTYALHVGGAAQITFACTVAGNSGGQWGYDVSLIRLQ